MSKKSVKITKGVLILAAIVIFFVLMGLKNKKKSNELNDRILAEVTLVSDGKIHAENEGKLVLVTGLVSFDEPVKFPELNYKLNTFKAKRIVRDYIKEGDGKDASYEWVERETPKTSLQTSSYADDDDYAYSGDYEVSDVFQPVYTTDNLFTEEKTVPVKIGEFKLDSTGMGLVDTSTALIEKDITVCGLSFTGLYYSDPAHKDEEKPGDVSVDYCYYDLSKSNKMTILAKQKGDSFTPYEFPGNKVYKVLSSNVNSMETLAASLDRSTKSDFKLRMVFVVIILAIGLLILKSGKNKNE